MPRRILIFSLAYHPFVGGAEIAIKEITDRISATDIEFDLITLRFDSSLPATETIGNVRVHRIGFTQRRPSMTDLVRFPLAINKYLFPFLALQKAKQLHAEKAFDGIWAMMANYAGFAALFFKRSFPKVAFVLTLQEGDPIDHIKRRVRFVYPLFVDIFKRASVIQTISKYLADFARSMGSTCEIEVIPNAVDTKLFSQVLSQNEADSLRKTLGYVPGTKYLVTTSRLVAKNAVDDVLRALAELPVHIHFLVLGTGPDEEQLKHIASTMHLADRVHFVGQIEHRDIPKYLHISDIFIRPSLSEGMGNSFIEAMAAGIPVIATPVGGIIDFLFDPENDQGKPATGLFCNVHDPKSIAARVTALMEDATLNKRLVQNARDMVFEKYDWHLIAKNMRDRVFSIVDENVKR